MKPARYDRIKRGVDVVVACVALVVTSPIQALVAVLVAVRLGRPVIFRQTRPGLDGSPFTILKFRTMLDVDPANDLVSDADRLTPFGRRLRSTSLDELPSLWNVLVGDLSIVGPRPLLTSYLTLYTPEQMRRHDVRPGITGLAQVRGRNDVPWVERLALDVQYVDQRSARLDLRILVETVLVVVSRRGITGAGSATMTQFVGAVDGRRRGDQ